MTDYPPKKEKQFQNELKRVASMLGWTYYFTADSTKSPPGFPDLVLVKPPRIIFAELKTETGVLSNHQKRWRALLLECPVVQYFCWRPSDWDQITDTLKTR